MLSDGLEQAPGQVGVHGRGERKDEYGGSGLGLVGTVYGIVT